MKYILIILGFTFLALFGQEAFRNVSAILHSQCLIFGVSFTIMGFLEDKA